MKKLLICSVLAAAAASFTGCQTTHIKTTSDGWEATINSHWFRRDVDKLSITKTGPDSYSIALNGYKSDASEQLPAFTREMFAGLVALGKLFPFAAQSFPQATAAAQTPQTLPPAAATNAQSQPGQPCTDGSCQNVPAQVL